MSEHRVRRVTRLLTVPLASATGAALLWLNTTGFCYNEWRYLPDEEIIQTTLRKDWREAANIMAVHQPKLQSGSLEELLGKTPVWGQVASRQISLKRLFSSDIETGSPFQVFRLIGIYRVTAILVFELESGQDRYFVWHRLYSQCGPSGTRGSGYASDLPSGAQPIHDPESK